MISWGPTISASGTYNFSLTNSDIVIEAFDRCRVRSTALTRNHLISARRSLNLELQKYVISGVALWEVVPFTFQLQTGVAVYTAGTGVTNIPLNTVTMLDVYFSLINGGGAGVNIDRILLPMSRTDYAQFSNKLQPGQPTMYWYEKLGSPQMTIFQPPTAANAYPNAQISGYAMLRCQDANLGSAETPDIVYRGLDALCAGLATRLALKYVDDAELRAEIKQEAKDAWELFSDDDREDVNISILPAQGYFEV